MDQQVVEYTRQLAVFTMWLVIATFIVAAIALVVGLVQAILSRNASRRALRAYVFVDTINLVDSSQLAAAASGEQSAANRELKETAPVSANRPGVVIVTKNSGQTPAYDVLHWGQIDVVERRHEGALVVPTLDPGAPKNYIAAGTLTTKVLWFQRDLSTQEISDIRSGTRAIYVFGRIDYTDAFKRSGSRRIA